MCSNEIFMVLVYHTHRPRTIMHFLRVNTTKKGFSGTQNTILMLIFWFGVVLKTKKNKNFQRWLSGSGKWPIMLPVFSWVGIYPAFWKLIGLIIFKKSVKFRKIKIFGQNHIFQKIVTIQGLGLDPWMLLHSDSELNGESEKNRNKIPSKLWVEPGSRTKVERVEKCRTYWKPEICLAD